MRPGSPWGTAPTSRTWSPTSSAFRPTFVLAVPRVFEKVYNARQAEGPRRRQGRDLRPGRAGRDRLQRGARHPGGPGLLLRLSTRLFDRLVYGKLRAALGGRCRAAISGGAPLGARLAHFFRGIGVTIFEGYGLTETSPAAAVNLARAHPDRHGRPAAARRDHPHRRRRRDPDQGRHRLPRVLEQRGGDRRGDRRRRLVPHRRPRRARRRRLPVASPAARRRSSSPPAARTSPRPCWRTGSARTRWSASAWSSATGSRSSPPWSPSTRRRGPSGWPTHGLPATADVADAPRRRAAARRGPEGDRRGQPAVSKAEAIKVFRILPARLHRGHRRADAVAEGQAQRGARRSTPTKSPHIYHG